MGETGTKVLCPLHISVKATLYIFFPEALFLKKVESLLNILTTINASGTLKKTKLSSPAVTEM